MSDDAAAPVPMDAEPAEQDPPRDAPASAVEPAGEHAEAKGNKDERGREDPRSDRKERERKDRDGDSKRGDDKKEDGSKRSSRRSRSRSKDRKSSRRSRSRDRKSSRRSRSRSRDRRRRSRSRSRDRKSSRRSRSRDRRRSRSRDRRRSRSRDRRHKGSRSDSSESDVGGYKPRKRQEPPVLANGPGTGADPFAPLRAAAVPTDRNAQLHMWQLQQLEARAMVLDQQAKSAATATSKTQREIYVGGLMPGVISGEALRTLFNSAITAQFAGFLHPGMDPVINVNLHPEGKYAFVEFRAPEMATAALALSGQVQLLGCTLSVARPSGYVDPSKAQNASAAANAALAAFKRGDMAALAAAATAGANLKGLGLPPHIEDPAAANALPPLPPGVVVEGLSGMATPCLCFIGMVTADRLKDDEEYNNMKEDLLEEFNKVVPEGCQEIKVPRPYDPSLADQYIGIADYGKVFAKLVSADAARVYREKIHGRLYDGQAVQVYFITEEAYAKVT